MSSKLAKEVIRNLINQNPTSKEIDFLIYIAMYQDADGVCRGIYYKDVMEALPCCKQTFYSMKKSLEQKGIIRTERESDMDYDITILGNDKSYQDGYLNVRKPVLHTQDFKSLPAGAKMISIDLIMLIDANKEYSVWDIGKDKFYERYLNFLPFKIEKKTLREYIRMMKKILVFRKAKTGSKTFKFCIVKKHRTENRPFNHKTDNEIWTEHYIQCLYRRKKMYINHKKIRDIAGLMLQYRQAAAAQCKSICNLIKWAFNKSLEKLQNKTVNEKLIHSYIKYDLYNIPLQF